MANYNVFIRFISELMVDGSISVPGLLFRCYKKLGLTEVEIMLILHLWCFAQNDVNRYPSTKELATCMTLNDDEIQKLIVGLMAKKLLSIERVFDGKQGQWVDNFSFQGLWDKLMEIWALNKARELEESNKFKHLSPSTAETIFQSFEEEFGRLLSPFESNQILEWCTVDNYDPDLIVEALRKASMRGIKNLKYIDTILNDWQQNNILTLKQVEEYEKQYQAKQQFKQGRADKPTLKEAEMKQKIEKYKDIYMS